MIVSDTLKVLTQRLAGAESVISFYHEGGDLVAGVVNTYPELKSEATDALLGLMFLLGEEYKEAVKLYRSHGLDPDVLIALRLDFVSTLLRVRLPRTVGYYPTHSTWQSRLWL